ncbi:MAG: hypothetical protein QM501_02065 [Gimesia sp.]
MNDETLRTVSIDGKTLCGTQQKHQRAIHLLSALDHQTSYILSQTQVDSKTNEAKAALSFLKGGWVRMQFGPSVASRNLPEHQNKSKRAYFSVSQKSKDHSKHHSKQPSTKPTFMHSETIFESCPT